MLQNDTMCSLLAIILVMMLLSSGMREWMRTGAIGRLPAAQGDCACAKGAVCGRKSETENSATPSPPVSQAASARVASAAAAPDDVAQPALPAMRSDQNDADSLATTLEGTKRNMMQAQRTNIGRQQMSTRCGEVSRTTGTPGLLEAVRIYSGEKNQDKNLKLDEVRSWAWSNLPESAFNLQTSTQNESFTF